MLSVFLRLVCFVCFAGALNINEIADMTMEIKQHFLGPHLHWHPVSSRVSWNCNHLMSLLNATKNATVVWPPPKTMPANLRHQFLLDGLSKELSWYDANTQQNGNEKPYEWTVETMKKFQNEPNTCGPFYRSPVCNETMTKYRSLIEGKHGMVIGTMDPWAEAWLLKTGAASVTTLEYHRIISLVPNLHSLHPSELSDSYAQGKRFDFIFTFSSLEHNGLGRWGDPINPWGDLEDIARCHCLLTENGTLFLGVPVGRDEVVWNAHRIYGRYRMHLALKNWRVVDLIGPSPFDALDKNGRWEDQPIIVLQRKQLKELL